MVWHVAHGSVPTRRMLDIGLRNFVLSAWSAIREDGPAAAARRADEIHDRGGRVFLDSGALSALRCRPARTDWLWRQDRVAEIGRALRADFVSHLDVPMERHGLRNSGLSRADAIRRTVANAVAFMDADVGAARKVYVLQGWTLEEYRGCLAAYRDHGIPDGRGALGLGTCCMRKGTRGLWQIAEWARRSTPGEWLHAFGVGDTSKIPRLAVIGYDSVDEGNTVRATYFGDADGRLADLVRAYGGYDA